MSNGPQRCLCNEGHADRNSVEGGRNALIPLEKMTEVDWRAIQEQRHIHYSAGSIYMGIWRAPYAMLA